MHTARSLGCYLQQLHRPGQWVVAQTEVVALTVYQASNYPPIFLQLDRYRCLAIFVQARGFLGCRQSSLTPIDLYRDFFVWLYTHLQRDAGIAPAQAIITIQMEVMGCPPIHALHQQRWAIDELGLQLHVDGAPGPHTHL